MSIYQCEKCGCAENTALGQYHCKNRPNIVPEEFRGMELCSACAPSKYTNGEPNDKFGKWHGRFKRTFLPKGSCFTNNQGNIEHKETGLIGNELYKELGSHKEYKD